MSTRSSVREFRHGLIKVKVVLRKSKGGLHYSLSIVRLYRNGDRWKESTRFGRDDIPVIRLALDEAYGWILLEQAAATQNGAASA